MRCECHHLREFRCGMDTHAESTDSRRIDPSRIQRAGGRGPRGALADRERPMRAAPTDERRSRPVRARESRRRLRAPEGHQRGGAVPTDPHRADQRHRNSRTARAGCHQLLRGGMAGALARRRPARTHRATRLAEPCGQLRVRAVAESAPHPHRLSPCRCARRAVTAHRRYRTGMDAVSGAARGRRL